MQLLIDFIVMKFINLKAAMKTRRCANLDINWGCMLASFNHLTGDFWVDTQTSPRPYLMVKHSRQLLIAADAQFNLAASARSRGNASWHYMAGLEILNDAKAHMKVAELTHEHPSIFEWLKISSRA